MTMNWRCSKHQLFSHWSSPYLCIDNLSILKPKSYSLISHFIVHFALYTFTIFFADPPPHPVQPKVNFPIPTNTFLPRHLHLSSGYDRISVFFSSIFSWIYNSHLHKNEHLSKKVRLYHSTFVYPLPYLCWI